MNTIELKNNFHHLIDSIDNEQMLANFYHIIKAKTNAKTGHLWASLNPDQKEALLKAFTESDNPENLLGYDAMKEKHKKWL
ncbi:hypothetical protein BY457_11710 [Marinilabilia salmonicolor]|jgi:hypothetical protein|uniref:hypothetical protein n=1 Tax=Marinilabilia salmonicolor TaxID=989 RepID=UPI000D06BF51|nr:hypothetical protein [Marinilabilia salmonicolor]PRY95962.1 hypothetical protein BY457_11710 [Marinilabilia salmonicolor]